MLTNTQLKYLDRRLQRALEGRINRMPKAKTTPADAARIRVLKKAVRTADVAEKAAWAAHNDFTSTEHRKRKAIDEKRAGCIQAEAEKIRAAWLFESQDEAFKLLLAFEKGK